MIKVGSYKATWYYKKNEGKFILFKDNLERISGIKTKSLTEFQIIMDLLRNESPIYFNAQEEFLATWHEETGEGE